MTSKDIPLGIDNGSNQIKLFRNTASTIIPSQAALGLSRQKGLEEAIDLHSFATPTRDGLATYHVKPACPLQTIGDEYQYSELNRVLVNYAIQQAGLGDKPVAICVGLPITHYYNVFDWSKRSDVIDKVVANLLEPVYMAHSIAGGNPDNYERVANIKSVDVISETVAAWMDDFLVYRDGTGGGAPVIGLDRKRRAEGRVYVDIGGNTTDVLIVSDEKIDGASQSYQQGGNHLQNALVKLIHSVTGIPINKIPDRMVLDAVNQGTVRAANGSNVSINKQVDEVMSQFFEQLRTDIRSLIGSNASGVTGVTFLGGTAKRYYDKQLQIFDKDFQMLHQFPELANARGMWKKAFFSVSNEK